MANAEAKTEVEIVAAALYEHRFARTPNGPWDHFKQRKPDVAKIFRENAEVAIKALTEARGAAS